jgi:hypothetical protein
MDALSRLERDCCFALPVPYRAFVERGYTTHPGPEYLWVNDAEWIPTAQIATYEGVGTPKAGLVPFAFTAGRDLWCWQTRRITPAGEPAITFCPHDCHEGEWFAPSFMGWLYRVGLEYASLIDEDESVTRRHITAWAQLVGEFGHTDWAAELTEISKYPVLRYREGRDPHEYAGLLRPEELRKRVAMAFGDEFVDAKYVWDRETDPAAG